MMILQFLSWANVERKLKEMRLDHLESDGGDKDDNSTSRICQELCFW